MAFKKKQKNQQEIAITPKKPKKREKNPHDKRRLTKRKLRDWMYGYIFLAPWIVGVVLFFVMSMVDSLNYSVHKIVMDNGVQMTALEHWYDNYISVFSLETDLPTTLGSFAISLVLQVPIIIAFSLIIAMLLNGKIRCRSVFRLIFFLPVIIATGPVMTMLTAQGAATVPMMSDGSLLNLLSGLPTFLLNPITELFNSLILILWNSGIQILIFLSGLQKVSTTMYEAAKIDGANGWETFWKITLPIVKPIILLNSIYTVVSLATGGTNPIIELIYAATYTTPWTKGYSYGMAFSWIYTAIIGVILIGVFLLLKDKSDKKVKYEKKLVTLR
ncbi:MAG: sugar ABC transporter permease [Clostridia bacterium]|nr:sugar ABC transporter permease [Clostridia bacterium]